ncbi:MAG: phage terminase large subunit, partial [Paraclostridium sp.]
INKMDHLKDSEIFKEFIEIKQYEKEIESLLQSSSLSDEDMDNLYQASIEVARMSYYTYFKLTFTANNPLVLGKHIELICDILTLAEMGLFKDKDTKSRIAISVPPRHLKSTCITNSFPAWFMGKEPWRSTIVTSYGDNLVQKAGQKNREKIQELSSMLFGARIKKDVGKKAEWELIGNGRFKGATIRGGATGEGAECFVGSTWITTNLCRKRISDIKVGDLVKCYDHEKSKFRFRKVLATKCTMTDRLIKIKDNSGSEIICTTNHPIFVVGKGYVPAIELKKGCELIREKGKKTHITNLELEYSRELVYDIQVEEFSNFFANGILVHNCLILDDLVKNREEANSKTIQEKIWDEYTDTYLTRVHQNGIIILIMTRWHNSDIRGKIDDNESNLKWLKCDLSAICETEEELASDPFERKIGEALYPQMYDERYFEPFKMNPRTWWSLYKQKPQVDSGEYFNRGYFQYFEYDDVFVTLHTETGKLQYLVKDCWLFQTIDTAQKTGQENDETGIITWVITPDNDLLMLDVYHGRIDVPTQEKVITQYWNKWQCNFQAIEDKQSGIGLIQKFKNEGRPIIELKAVGDKIERSTTAQIFYANMKVYHLKGAEWLGYLENQLLEFPSAKHDDLMDCVAYGAKVVADRSGISSIL